MRTLGITLLFIGISIITYCSYTWVQERNMVKHFTENEFEERNVIKYFNENDVEEQGKKITKKMDFTTGEQVANLFIPSIDKKYPVFLGTEPDVLKKGAGMYESKWTTLPSDKGHTEIWITDKDDRNVIIKKDQPVLTLTTCYPFYYIGNAPKRYVIEATLTEEPYLVEGSM
jgi:sortase A